MSWLSALRNWLVRRRDRATNPRPSRLIVATPAPIQLTPSQWEVVDRKIARILDESTPDPALVRPSARAQNALPLFQDWGTFMALRRDGQLVWLPNDSYDPHEVEIVSDVARRHLGLAYGGLQDPDLFFLAPVRTADALVCDGCRGTGELDFGPGSEKILKSIVCSCGGCGWVPRDAARGS